MYKNLLIVGSNKSGKTTLANMIAKKFDCNVINLDILIEAFEQTFPKEDNDNYVEFETKFIINYINQILDKKNFYKGKKNILEGKIPHLEQVIPELDNTKIAIIGLTYNDVNLEKFSFDIKEFADKLDIYNHLPEHLIKKRAKKFIEDNNEIGEILDNFDINSYDVSTDRYDNLKSILSDVEELTSINSSYKVKQKK